MRKIIALALALALLFCALPFSIHAETATETARIPEPTLSPDADPYDPEHPELLEEEQLYAASAILLSQDRGEVIFEKDADAIRYPASTTKILTVLLGLMFVEDLNQIVTVSDTAMMIPDDSSTMYLHVGEEIPFIDVLYGTMLLSGNDGANVIAETVSGSIDRFVALMNETAAAFGCTSTHFANAHGYHDDNHYTTARDIAIIAREAMKNDMFREIAGTVTYQISRTNKQRARTITTKSEYMLTGSDEKPNKYYYEYATGIKTGHHSMSGYCFVGSATKDNVSLISVVMFTGYRARWADTIKLMDYGFSQYMSVTPVELYNMNPITIETSGYSTSDTDRGRVQLICQATENTARGVRIEATKNEIERLAANLTDVTLIEYSRDFVAPIQAGEVMGSLTWFTENGMPVVYQLTASRNVDRRENAPKTLAEIRQETWDDPNPFPPFNFEMGLILLVPIVGLALLILILRIVRKRRRSGSLRTPKPVNRYLK